MAKVMGKLIFEKKKENEKVPIPDTSNDTSQEKDQWSTYRENDTPMIYMCATMWHESEKEMVQILKSIFRYLLRKHQNGVIMDFKRKRYQ